MLEQRDQGLGLSLLVYVGALLGGLALFVAPVLWAYGPTEYPNPELPKYDITSSTPLAKQHDRIPLANLKREEIVTSKMLAAVNAKPEKPVREKAVAGVPRGARTAFAQAHDDDDHPAPPPRRSGFRLFGIF